MADVTSQNRLTDQTMTVSDFIFALSGGNPGAITVLIQWIKSSPLAVLEFLVIDSKRLYDHRIWELYKLCNEDINRFMYHVLVELPNQETGELTVSGPYSIEAEKKEFWAKRTSGKPGSFWALDNPPQVRAYQYPIQ